MVTTELAWKWSPRGVLQRLRILIRQPADVALTLRIGYCWWRLPRLLAHHDLPALLARLRSSSRPAAPNPQMSMRRISRLRQPWERLGIFRDRNTCYMRALVLYRFLDPGSRVMHIHFGVEPGIDPSDRLHGHAWITVGNEMFEAPDPVRAGRVREIYRYPDSGRK